MIGLAGAQSGDERIGKCDLVSGDPRRPMKYLSGHLSGAVNLPVYRAFGDNGSLLDPGALAEWLGAGGVGEGHTPAPPDSPRGHDAARPGRLIGEPRPPGVFLLAPLVHG